MNESLRKTMSDDMAQSFCEHIFRSESFEKPTVYIKAVIVTLQLLGYDEHWLYDVLKPMLLREFKSQKQFAHVKWKVG